MWYVVQVGGGRELATLETVSRAVDAAGAGEVFVPRRESMRHRVGEWVKVQEVLFPGYLFVDTDDPKAVAAALAKVNAFARLLGGDGGFVPVSREERSFIEAMCGQEGPRIAAMSEGVIEGGEVRVLSGPLCGMEGAVTKVDRHKRAAYVRMRLLGREVDVKLGLEIVHKA